MKLQVFYHAYGERVLMGTLSDTAGGISFVYDPHFLGLGIEVSPFKLPLENRVFHGDRHYADGLAGVFSDSLPDAWGCLLLDRKLSRAGRLYSARTPLERLALAGSNPWGALEYEPAETVADEKELKINLDILAEDAECIWQGRPSGMLEELIKLNGSSGGARPKITALVSKDKKQIIYQGKKVPRGFSPWLIKFAQKLDRPDIGVQEYVYSLLAKKAGIKMPETFLFPSQFGPGHFGVQRFDRVGPEKVHVHTASGLLHADFRTSYMDYANLLKLTAMLTKDQQDVEQMVRLMIFNVKAGNKDDHSKNFSFYLDRCHAWHLAPAYDLTRSEGINGEHTAMVNGKGKDILDQDLIEEAAKANVSGVKVKAMLEQVQDALADYEKLMQEFKA